jgi:hypothetical protein
MRAIITLIRLKIEILKRRKNLNNYHIEILSFRITFSCDLIFLYSEMIPYLELFSVFMQVRNDIFWNFSRILVKSLQFYYGSNLREN